MAPTIHGHNTRGSPSRTHRSWSTMLQRCTNKNNPRFNKYGGNGIAVCARWFLFENFLYDMGERPKNMSIDRIDVNGNYEPSNCRWADAKLQARNKHLGKTRKLTEFTVSEIRSLKGSATNEIIGKKFGVTKATIAKIYRGEIWVGS